MKPNSIRTTFLTAVAFCAIAFSPVAAVPVSSGIPNAAQTNTLAKLAETNDVHRDVLYKRVGDTELTLDLILPKKAALDAAGWPNGIPVVIHVHGGGWMGGKRFLSISDSRFLTNHGIGVAQVSYRLCNATNGITINDCVTDAFDAARFLVKNAARYNIDPARLFVFGHSAGGHLTLMLLNADPAAFPGDPALAGVTPRLAGGVALSPPTGLDAVSTGNDGWFSDKRRPNNFEIVLGGPVAEKAALIEKVSPITWLKKDCPRTVIFHGDADELVNIKGPRIYAQKAKEIGADVVLVEFPNANHGFNAIAGKRAPLRTVWRLALLDNLLDMVEASAGKSDFARWNKKPLRTVER